MSDKPHPGSFRLLYFASAASYTKKPSEDFLAPLPVLHLFGLLESRYGGITVRVLSSSAVTVNLDYVDLGDGSSFGGGRTGRKAMRWRLYRPSALADDYQFQEQNAWFVRDIVPNYHRNTGHKKWFPEAIVRKDIDNSEVIMGILPPEYLDHDGMVLLMQMSLLLASSSENIILEIRSDFHSILRRSYLPPVLSRASSTLPIMARTFSSSNLRPTICTATGRPCIFSAS